MYSRVGRSDQVIARHYFSEAYVRDLLGNNFEIDALEHKQYQYDGEPSSFLHVQARKR